MARSDTITIVISGFCNECGCRVFPENVGFECDTFVVCQECLDKEDSDYYEFLEDMYLETV